MTLFARFEIVLAKLGSCCCTARTTVRFFPHERTYGAGTVIRSPLCHANGWRCRLPVPPLDFLRDILLSTSRGSFPPYFNVFFEFCSSSSWRCCRVIFFKACAPNCSVCFGFLRELRGAPAFVYYILVRRVLEFNDLAFMDFCLLANVSNFFWFLKTV